MAVAAVAMAFAASPAGAAEWITTALPWKALPAQKPAGPLPQTFAMPAKAWTYGACSDRTDVFAKTDAVILRVDLAVTAGKVGLSLMSADGAALLSKEQVLTPDKGVSHAYFRLTPSGKPSILVLRNYDDDGRVGSVNISRTQFIRESDLSNQELTDIVKEGVL
jgi:hypothetical protein